MSQSPDRNPSDGLPMDEEVTTPPPMPLPFQSDDGLVVTSAPLAPPPPLRPSGPLPGGTLPPPIQAGVPGGNTGQGGSRGCLWASASVFGCFVLILSIGAGMIFVGGQTVNGVLSGVRDFFAGVPAEQRLSGIFIPTVERVKALSELTTMRYNYANIITSELQMPGILNTLYGDSLVMVAVGHIEASIDLSTLTQEDVVIDQEARTVRLRLPAPRIKDCFLNENDSYVVSRSTGLFASPAPNLDTEARRFAIRQFRTKAVEDGLLADAQAQAERVMREFVQLFNEEQVTVQILFADSIEAPLPATCS